MTKVNNFLNYLAGKYNFRVNLAFSKVSSHYIGFENTIYLSQKDIDRHSEEELLWIVAHEYKHALLHREKKIWVEELWWFSTYLPYVALFLISILARSLFDEQGVFLYIFLGLCALPLVMIKINPFWYNARRFTEEELCDQFANEIVGTGQSLWEKRFDEMQTEVKVAKIQLILTLGFYSPTHPLVSERLGTASKYSPNTELIKSLS